MEINPEFRLKRIIRTIKEGKINGISAELILKDLEQIIPPKIIEIEKPLKTSKEKLEYDKNYYKYKQEEAKIQSKREKLEQKIKKALERTSFYCYNCKKHLNITNPEDNQHEIVQKGNRTKKNLKIINKCPECNSILKAFGGYILKL